MADGQVGSEGFGPENLPFGVARLAGGATACVSALGHRVVDLSVLDRADSFAGLDLPDHVFEDASLNRFLACGRATVEDVRRRLAELVGGGGDRHGGDRHGGDRLEAALVPRVAVELLVPVEVGDFVDFSGSLHHALNMGRLFRPGGDALPPNWRSQPRAYHGRAGSLMPSGAPILRPHGPVPSDGGTPEVRTTRALDLEAEVGFVVGTGSEAGRPVKASAFSDHVAGLVLLNDWSARDVQAIESHPLGPFLGKSFATTVSPWLVTLDALEPYRVDGRGHDPPGPPYLAPPPLAAFDIRIEVSIESQWMRINDMDPVVISRSSFADHYWTLPQMLAHATVNGAPLRTGDLFGSGAVSGPERGSEGSLIELSGNGDHPVALPDGTRRSFLEDGDTVTISAWAGGGDRPLLCLGEASGTVRAAHRLEV